MEVFPHAENGRRCVCGRPVFLTEDGWKARGHNGNHPEPRSRRIEQMYDQVKRLDQPPRA